MYSFIFVVLYTHVCRDVTDLTLAAFPLLAIFVLFDGVAVSVILHPSRVNSDALGYNA